MWLGEMISNLCLGWVLGLGISENNKDDVAAL